MTENCYGFHCTGLSTPEVIVLIIKTISIGQNVTHCDRSLIWNLKSDPSLQNWLVIWRNAMPKTEGGKHFCFTSLMDSKAAMSDLEDDEEMNLGWFSLETNFLSPDLKVHMFDPWLKKSHEDHTKTGILPDPHWSILRNCCEYVREDGEVRHASWRVKPVGGNREVWRKCGIFGPFPKHHRYPSRRVHRNP